MIAFYDTECFPNYWLLKFRPRAGAVYSFRLHSGERLSGSDAARIRLLFAAYETVSFNGNYYDVPMIAAALAGNTAEQLKWFNDQIIVEKVKPWELPVPEWKPDNHIDIIEVAPGTGSQKQYAGRIHYKTMRDLPYDPATHVTPEQITNVDEYCENDLGQLEALFDALAPQLEQRVALSARYGIDLRSKSDAQLAEAVLKLRCEKSSGRKIYKPEIDWNLSFRFNIPAYVGYQLPQLCRALELVRTAIFRLGASGAVEMPFELEGLEITIGQSTYKLGIGGLHSQEKRAVHVASADVRLMDIDVASYYPTLILNSGEVPKALGAHFAIEYAAIKRERLAAKNEQGALKKAGDTKSPAYVQAAATNEGGKIQLNGTFGKTGSPYSVLFAPEMLIQTTLSGQLSLLMLIEWHEANGISIVSANTDGIVVKCSPAQVTTSDWLVKEWEKRTGLEMETTEYSTIFSRDINNYFAIKTDGEVKRKGEYAKAGLIAKKNPDTEICSDAVAEFLSKGTPVMFTISACRDIRKFVTIQKVNGGAVKMWGEGVRKGSLVRDMVPTLHAAGWIKVGRKWARDGISASPGEAYAACFAPQRPEYLGKVVRWYYGKNSPGPIVYATNGNTVSLSYGATPCMTLPAEFPDDIDYDWYIAKAENILRDIGYYRLT